MRAIIQRVSNAQVTVANEIVGAINHGMVVLLGIGQDDTAQQIEQIGRKIIDLRIFDDESGKPNVALRDSGGAVLLISQFTLYADVSRGRRPGYSHAAHPDIAAPLVEQMAAFLRSNGITVETGQFGAEMRVALINEGPYTIILDSDTLNMPAGKHTT